MLRRTFFALLMILALGNASRSASAHDSDVDLDDNVLTIESDDSHDILVVRPNPNDPDEIEVLIMQFDDPVNLFDFASEEEAIDAADDFRDEYYDADDVDAIEIYALGGDDWVLITSNLPCKIVGGNGGDWIYSGNGPDVIWGDDEWVTSGVVGGEDTIAGRGGVDEIHGGPFDDEIRGGTSGDILYGDDGEDTIFGDSGDDDIYGGNHKDTLFGGSDNDDMFGGSGDDDMDGGPGNDTMWGGWHNDTMTGGTGHDELHGEHGDDDLFGEEGQDDLFGGNNNDYLDGGYDGEIDVLEGGSGVDEFVNRYFEVRTYTYYRAEYYYVPTVVWVRGLPRITYVRQVIWVPVSGTYEYNFEVEFLNDYSAADGDILSPVEVN